jgi:hypothetical protein
MFFMTAAPVVMNPPMLSKNAFTGSAVLPSLPDGRARVIVGSCLLPPRTDRFGIDRDSAIMEPGNRAPAASLSLLDATMERALRKPCD